MERNPNEGLNAQSGTTGSGFAASGATGGTAGQERGSGAGSTSGGGYGSTAGSEHNRLEQGKEALGEKLGAARQKAGDLKSTLADKLDAGAERLRQRSRSGSYAGSTGAGTVPLEGDGQMNAAADKLAGGLHNTAAWLRDTDLDSLRTDVERQVREHPGRTLLIAAGIGYLLGKAFRR
jgi:hypothetical protein